MISGRSKNHVAKKLCVIFCGGLRWVPEVSGRAPEVTERLTDGPREPPEALGDFGARANQPQNLFFYTALFSTAATLHVSGVFAVSDRLQGDCRTRPVQAALACATPWRTIGAEVEAEVL
jgi:hypothetical protein